MNKIQLGLNIKQARKKLGLTQEELANKLNVSSNYISAIECGKKTPKLEMFFKIADVLNVNLGILASDLIKANRQNIIPNNNNYKISSLNENEYKLLKNTLDNLFEYFKNYHSSIRNIVKTHQAFIINWTVKSSHKKR